MQHMFQQCPSFAVCLSVVGWFGSPVQIRCVHESASLASSSSSLTLLPCVSHAHQPEGGGMLLHSVYNCKFEFCCAGYKGFCNSKRHTDTTSADWDACLHSSIKDYSQAFRHCQMLCRFIGFVGVSVAAWLWHMAVASHQHDLNALAGLCVIRFDMFVQLKHY